MKTEIKIENKERTKGRMPKKPSLYLATSGLICVSVRKKASI